MPESNENHAFKDAWIQFGQTIAHPWSVAGIVLGIFIGLGLFRWDTEPTRTILLGLLALLTAVLGGLWTNRWLSLSERSEIEIRGLSAIRGLGLLHNDVNRVEGRLRKHVEAFCTNDEEAAALKEALEGTVELCRAMKSGVVDATEHWADVVPEADVRKQLGIVTEILDQKERAEARVSELEDTLQKEGERSATDKEKLEHELEKERKTLNSLRTKLREKESAFPLRLENPDLSSSLLTFKAGCKKCGKDFDSTLIDDGVCRDCRGTSLLGDLQIGE